MPQIGSRKNKKPVINSVCKTVMGFCQGSRWWSPFELVKVCGFAICPEAKTREMTNMKLPPLLRKKEGN
ncbi:hypothetical protein K7X08_017329 [Anisodus acutangulus]|uniref:Uncharacterized protein n=1 Tax=Anisodus acutangulus TaxID=402998 RepID=A0A9Q1LTJ6_9SOLA|nr:hypothetical protein K7X08_017329 [Anisodus acutangulus]